jgi:hypothetical protein
MPMSFVEILEIAQLVVALVGLWLVYHQPGRKQEGP